MGKRKTYSRADLNEKQSAFVDEYIARGATREAATDAVKSVYGYDGNSASVQANRLLKNEKVRDVIVEESLASFAAMGAVGADQLMEILTTGMWFGQSVKPNDGLRAIAMALDRGLGPIAHVTDLNVNHQLDDLSGKQLRQAVIEELRKIPDKDRSAMLASLGISPDAKIIDVEAVAVDPEAPWGRKEDGTPKKKPGNKPKETPQHLITAYHKRDGRTDLEKRIDAIKKAKLARKRTEAANG